MAFTTNMSTTAEVDNSIIELMDAQYLIAAGQDAVMEQFVSVRRDIGAKSIEMPKYSRLALATTSLDQDDDVTSEALADAQIILTPAEYGKVVTTTKLANLQTGGKADLVAARLVGVNQAATLDKLAVLALEASSNSATVDAGAESALDATDVMTHTFFDKMYNKLSRASIPKLNGAYVAVVHEDVAYDLRQSTHWLDVMKYAAPQNILMNEIGMLKGFRVIVNNHCSISDDAGASAVDTYKSIFMGFNALGKAVSKDPAGVITGPFDKLARFVNIGWHGCLQYKIVDQDALWVGISASSVGANT
jgi:N4-gp56 family major capsid protein